jgi:hypothetical protein
VVVRNTLNPRYRLTAEVGAIDGGRTRAGSATSLAVRYPEVRMISIGGQRSRTQAASFTPSMLPGISMLVKTMRISLRLSKIRIASSAFAVSMASNRAFPPRSRPGRHRNARQGACGPATSARAPGAEWIGAERSARARDPLRIAACPFAGCIGSSRDSSLRSPISAGPPTDSPTNGLRWASGDKPATEVRREKTRP